MVGRNIQREFDVLYPAFSAALAETIAWCTREDRPAAPHKALWSDDLREVAAPEARYDQGMHRGVWYGVLDAAPKETVQRVRRVAAARRQLIAERRLATPEADGRLHQGRLLAFDPTISVWCEGSAQQSHGLLDESDGPGWDSWVMAFEAGPGGYRRGGGKVLVLSWIPRELQTLAAEGVLANPVECVWWPPRSADAKACLMSILTGTAG